MGSAASAAVATTSAAQTANPTTNSQTRVVPRSRIVARSAVYSSASRPVMNISSSRGVTFGLAPRESVCTRASIVAQELVSAEFGPLMRSADERRRLTKVTIGDDNSLAVYQMSRYNAVVNVLKLHTSG